MKAKFYLLNMLLALMACTTFTSCDWWDEDYDQSKVLSGQWQGDFGMNYQYTFNYRGRTYTETFDSYDTDVVFYPDYNGATHGYGKQVDWYEYGPYEKIYHRFDWKIVNGVVQLRYPDDPRMSTDIYDYHMTNDYFSGYFDYTKESFKLRKLADYYNWTPYVNTYSYYDRYNWYDPWYNNYYGRSPYYAKTRSNTTDSVTNSIPEILPQDIDYSKIEGGKITGFGNRYTKK